MKKMLMLASVPSMIGQFNMDNIEILKSMGFEVYVACNFKDYSVWDRKRIAIFKRTLNEKKITYYQIDFSRKVSNILLHLKSFKQVKNLLTYNNYDFIHCHTPIGGTIGRMAAICTQTKVIYTAHGFHFYTGASLINWILFYPIEKYLSYCTDVLITINKEDYERATKRFHAKKNTYVPGVGIDTIKFNPNNITTEQKKAKRKELEIDENDVVLLSIGELNKNKNHKVIINALSKSNLKNIKYLICGSGNLEEELNNLICKCGLEKQVVLLGYQPDILLICMISDIFLFPSLREGLSVSLMEAMASGLPVIASKIRGNTDLIKNNFGGYLIELNKFDSFLEAIHNLVVDKEQRRRMSIFNLKMIEKFELKYIRKKMKKIYGKY